MWRQIGNQIWRHCSNKLKTTTAFAAAAAATRWIHYIFLKMVTIHLRSDQYGWLTERVYCCWLAQFVNPNGLTCFCVLFGLFCYLIDIYRPLFGAICSVRMNTTYARTHMHSEDPFAIGGVQAHGLISALQALAAMVIVVYQTPKAFCVPRNRKNTIVVYTDTHTVHCCTASHSMEHFGNGLW